MNGDRNRGRNAVALVASVVLHVLVLVFLVRQPEPVYVYPPPAPVAAVNVEIVTLPPVEIIRPPKVPLKPKVTPPQPQPQPPRPAPPATQPKPPTPQPQKPLPEKPAPPKPTPPQPTPPKPSPLPAPVAPPKPAPPPPTPAPAKAAPPQVQAAPKPAPVAPAPPVNTRNLNLHKPKEEAPAGVPTLPIAPSSGAAGAPTAGGAVGAPQGSRLGGLSPFPYGAMPSGGPGLRGTLVGCANADSVKLTSVERAHCNERFGQDISKAPALDPIPAAKRAEFDRAAGRQERDRVYRASATPNGGGGPSDPGAIAHGPASSEVFRHNAGEP